MWSIGVTPQGQVFMRKGEWAAQPLTLSEARQMVTALRKAIAFVEPLPRCTFPTIYITYKD